MAYRDSYGGFGGFSITPWVKRLLIINTALYVAVLLGRFFIPGSLVRDWFAFQPADFLTRPWTLVTYAFFHAGVMHLLGNMLMLFFFGPPLEERWGSRQFLRVYLIAAAGGALFSVLFAFLDPASYIVGASGATLGLMLAFAMIWPDMEIHIWGIFPVKAKWLVGVLIFINLATAIEGSGGQVAVLAHLGGMAAAFLYLKSPWAPHAWGEVPRSARKPSGKRGGVALVPWGGKKQAAAAAQQTATVTQARPAAARKGKSNERELLDDVDRILDKISAQGLGSLTEEERKRLDEVSRRYRTN
ncbi:MAG TPA: rhomboid family intramembrane serine protease [Longimicrobium sp.]|nr:rhomboid family intramembrane serine protease [Longimicrobium sp.]